MAAGMLVALLAGAWWLLRPAAPPESVRVAHSDAANARFVGSESCAACHQKAYSDWKGSQHQRAMQAMTPDTVLGNFDQAKFRYAGVESTFFQRDGKYFVNTDGPDGKMADFEIKYTFGV